MISRLRRLTFPIAVSVLSTCVPNAIAQSPDHIIVKFLASPPAAEEVDAAARARATPGTRGASADAFELFEDSDISGDDYLVMRNVAQSRCVAACAADVACGAFTYNQGKNVCFLKGGAGSPTDFVGALSGRKRGVTAAKGRAAETPRIPGFEVLAATDLPGGDLYSVRGADPERCASLCIAEPQCMGFTFNLRKNVCFLKTDTSGPAGFMGALSARKLPPSVTPGGEPEAVRGFARYDDTDLPGGDYRSGPEFSGLTLDECQSACLLDEDCKAYTYNEAKKLCLPKNGTRLGVVLEPMPFRGAVSGLKGDVKAVAAARRELSRPGADVPRADLAWRRDDTEQSFVARVRGAAKPMGGTCAEDEAKLSALARSVKGSIDKTGAVAGKPFTVTWNGQPGAGTPPAWLIVAADRPVRFSGDGFYVLGPEATAPFGLGTAKRETRAFTALSGKKPPEKGQLEVVPLLAGPLRISVFLAGYERACGKEFEARALDDTLNVATSNEPTFQVRDPFSFEQPAKVLLSPDGLTETEVFDGRYRLTDGTTSAVLADRNGHQVAYSATGRFLTAASGEGGVDVVDTVDGAVVKTVGNSVIGWENKDSFLVEGASGNGLVAAHSPFNAAFEAGGAPSCRVCPGRETSAVIDLENDVIHGVGERGSNERGVEFAVRLSRKASLGGLDGGVALPDTDSFVAAQTHVAPVFHPEGWSFRGGLMFAPYDFDDAYLASGSVSETDRETMANMLPQEAKGREGASRTAKLEARDIGTVRSVVALPRAAKQSADRLRPRLADLGLRFPEFREPTVVKSGKADWQADWAIARQIARSVPKARKTFVQSEFVYPCHTEEGDGIYGQFDKVERYELPGRSLWLTMLVCAEGSAAFYKENFYLFDSSSEQSYAPISAENAEETSGNSCGQNIAHCNFASRLYGDRYLLIWSSESRAVAIFDVELKKMIFQRFDLERGDLLKEAFYSPEDRHVTQVNTDGSFFVYDTEDGSAVLEGRYVDDETIAWTPDLHFDASPEGANYVGLRFPGQRGQYSFEQYSRLMRRSGLVGEVFGRRYEPSSQALASPPDLTGEVKADALRIKGKIAVSSPGTVRVFQDGLETDSLAVVEAGRPLVFDVARVPGARWVSFVAIDEARLTSRPMAQEMKGDAGVLPVVRALAIGVDRYESGLAPLGYATEDSGTLLSALAAQDGKSIRLGSSVRLTDADATPEAILAEAEKMVRMAGKGETIVLSFAGHGVTGPDGRFYMATARTEARDVASTALPWMRLASILSKARSRVVVLLDACHSGAAGTSLFATNDDAVDAVLEGVPSGLLVVSASKGRQLSEESREAGGGLFTTAVAEVIAGKRAAYDLDRNGAIEVSELYLGVKRLVSERSGGRQVPWLARNQLVGDFALF